MFKFLRYFVVPFCLVTLLFTLFLQDVRSVPTEWMLLNTLDNNTTDWRSQVYILHVQDGHYRQLPGIVNGTVQTLSSDGQWLYFDALAEQKYEGRHYARDIYRLQLADFAHVENLTHDEFSDDYLSGFSPDAAWIYYSSEKAYASLTERRDYGLPGDWRTFYRTWQAHSYWWEVFRMKPDGSQKERLTISPNLNNWFVGNVPDQETLVMQILNGYGHFRGAQTGLYASALYQTDSTGHFQSLIYFNQQNARIEVLGFSPDGVWIYCFVMDQPDPAQSLLWRFYRVRVDGTAQEMLDDSSMRVQLLGYLADDTTLYYRKYTPVFYDSVFDEAWSDLYISESQDPLFSRRILALHTFMWGFSPDQQWIYYTQDGHQIYRLNTTTYDVEALANLNDYNYFLAYSLDGEWLYFRSVNNHAQAYLYKMRPDGSDLTKLGDISDLDMCVYPNRCQDNLFVVDAFGMPWHPTSLQIANVGMLALCSVLEIFFRRRRHEFPRAG